MFSGKENLLHKFTFSCCLLVYLFEGSTLVCACRLSILDSHSYSNSSDTFQKTQLTHGTWTIFLKNIEQKFNFCLFYFWSKPLTRKEGIGVIDNSNLLKHCFGFLVQTCLNIYLVELHKRTFFLKFIHVRDFVLFKRKAQKSFFKFYKKTFF